MPDANFCPLLKDLCKKEACMWWRKYRPDGGKKDIEGCAIYQISSDLHSISYTIIKTSVR